MRDKAAAPSDDYSGEYPAHEAAARRKLEREEAAASAGEDLLVLEGKAAGRAAGILIARQKADAEPVARKLEARAQIVREMAEGIGATDAGDALRAAADELDAAAEIIRRLGMLVPRTAKDEANEWAVQKLVAALKTIRDEHRVTPWCVSVARSALESLEEIGLDV